MVDESPLREVLASQHCRESIEYLLETGELAI